MSKGLRLLILALTFLVFLLCFPVKYVLNNENVYKGIGFELPLPLKNTSPLCTPPQYIFPKETLESDVPLPEKVKDSFKSTIGITVEFILNTPNMGFVSEPRKFIGSGFFVEGIYLSARHIFFTEILELNRGRFPMPFAIDKNGLPHSSHYHYCFYGTADVGDKPVTFPLELIGMGDPYLEQDFVAFKAINGPSLKSLEFEERVSLGDIVYSSGRVPLLNPSNRDLYSVRKDVLVDFVNYTFSGQISALLSDMPHNKAAGLEKIYRVIRSPNNVEPGYSGGPVADKNGRVVAMTILTSPGDNFSLAISAKDLKRFMQNIKKIKKS